MIHPSATIKTHRATLHHAADLADLAECGVRAADGVPASPFLHADVVIVQRELFRPSGRAAMESLVRQVASLPNRPVLLYLSHCSIADMDTGAWRAGGWPRVGVPEILGARYRCASEQTAKALGEFMPSGDGKSKRGWRKRCGAHEEKRRKATRDHPTGRGGNSSVPGCRCDMTEEERDAVQAGFARARRMERKLAARYNLTFVDTCAAFRSMLPEAEGSHRGGGGGFCVDGDGGVGDAASAKKGPYFDHPTAMQPAFFAHEPEARTAAGGDEGKKAARERQRDDDRTVENRFDWLHYRYEDVALQACLMAHAVLVPRARLSVAPQRAAAASPTRAARSPAHAPSAVGANGDHGGGGGGDEVGRNRRGA